MLIDDGEYPANFDRSSLKLITRDFDGEDIVYYIDVLFLISKDNEKIRISSNINSDGESVFLSNVLDYIIQENYVFYIELGYEKFKGVKYKIISIFRYDIFLKESSLLHSGRYVLNSYLEYNSRGIVNPIFDKNNSPYTIDRLLFSGGDRIYLNTANGILCFDNDGNKIEC